MKIVQAILILAPALAKTSDAQYLRRKLSNEDADVDTITFDDPTHHQKLVDWCLTFQQDCGKPAADAYCAEKGYGEAVSYPKRRTYNQETLTMKTHATCTPAHSTCDTFDYITCRVKTQTFENPQEHNYALDGCYEWETECGGPAADAFCEDKGYTFATDYSQIKLEGDAKTMTIGDHAVCDPEWHECSTFSYITCIASPEDMEPGESGDEDDEEEEEEETP